MPAERRQGQSGKAHWDYPVQKNGARFRWQIGCCSGDSAEITWIDSGFTDDQEKYVTELQIPVVSRTSGGYTESIGKDF